MTVDSGFWIAAVDTAGALIWNLKGVGMKGKKAKKKEGHYKQSEETEYKIHMTGLVILNANAGHVFPRVTHWFFYW